MQKSPFIVTEAIREQQRIAHEPDVAIKMMVDMRGIWPVGYLPADDKVFYNRVYWSLRSSREFGLRRIDLRQKWIMLGSLFFPYFWVQEQARAYLSQPGHDPHIRFADYHAIITALNKRQANPWPLV